MQILILLVVGASAVQAAMASEESSGCNPTMMLNCFYSVLGTRDLGNSPMMDMPDSPEKLKEQCFYTEQLIVCMNGVIDKCGTEEETQLIRKEFNNAIDIKTELCKEGSSLNTRFFANVNCFQKSSDAIKNCSLEFLQKLSALQSDKDPAEMLQITCCAFHEYDECLRNSVSFCSKDAIDFVEDYFGRSLGLNVNRCINDFDIPPTKCQMNASASHNLSITLLFILLFIVSSKTIFFNSI